MIRVFCVVLLLLIQFETVAQELRPPLPEPLNLQQAQALAADDSHAVLVDADAQLEQSQSDIQQAEANYALQSDLEIRAAWFEPSSFSLDQDGDDHRARLRVSKPLYDFGQTEKKLQAAKTEHQATQDTVDYLVKQRRLQISRDFFAVILADLKFAWDNEDMATAYIRFDRAQERHGLGQISDVELLAAEHDYERVKNRRYESESAQFLRRVALAESLNRPGELSSELIKPELDEHNRVLPEYETLLEMALENNPQNRRLSAMVDAAHMRLQAARQQTRPRLDARFEVSEYTRDSGSNDDWRATLNLTLPLLEHEGMQAEISRLRSTWLKRRAMLLDMQSQVRQRVLQLWQQIQLLKSRRQQMLQAMDYRELDLDRSRTLYELEVKTNLGNAMVAISEARFNQAKTEFDLALAWMELELMVGKAITTGGIQ